MEEKAIFKECTKTGRKYFANNIPVGRLTAFMGVTGRYYKIFPENGTADMWYKGEFLGDRYAVFMKYRGVYQQISPWYEKYGNAVRYMTTKCG